MNRKRMLQRIAALALCLTMAAHGFGGLSPTYAVGAGRTVYTFGSADGPWRDLAAEHEQESKQREKERRKVAQKQAMLEKAAMKKAAREAREREKRDKATKNGAQEGANGEAA